MQIKYYQKTEYIILKLIWQEEEAHITANTHWSFVKFKDSKLHKAALHGYLIKNILTESQ